MSEIVRPSRRAVLGAAAWSAPVIVVATAAPALAATNNTVTVRHTAAKSGTNIRFTGTVTTSSSGTTATLRWIHRCDDTGDAAGAFVTGGSYSPNDWSVSTATYQARIDNGTTYREVLVEATRVIPANATVNLPTLNLALTESSDRGNSTAAVTATSPATVQQAGTVRWRGSGGGTVTARATPDAIAITVPK